MERRTIINVNLLLINFFSLIRNGGVLVGINQNSYYIYSIQLLLITCRNKKECAFNLIHTLLIYHSLAFKWKDYSKFKRFISDSSAATVSSWAGTSGRRTEPVSKPSIDRAFLIGIGFGSLNKISINGLKAV